MTHWNTQKIKSDFEALGFNVDICSPGGDMDTECVSVRVKPESSPGAWDAEGLSVTGFVFRGETVNKKDIDVDFVELTDGEDSSGGLTSSDPAMFMAYHVIRKYLDTNGFLIANHYHDYI